MATFQRLIRVALLSFLALFAGAALAYPAKKTPVGNGYSQWVATQNPICVSQFNTPCTIRSSTLPDGRQYSEMYYTGVNSAFRHSDYVTEITYSCPAGGALTGSVCICSPPSVDTGTACSLPPPPPGCAPNGTLISPADGRLFEGGAGYTGGVYCSSGCGVRPQFSSIGADGRTYAGGDQTSTGNQCSARGDSGSTACATTPGCLVLDGLAGADPKACSAGKCPGQVNGVEVCVPCTSTTSGSSSSSSSTTTVAADGTTSTTSPNGTSTSSTTTCAGTVCTTVTTTSSTPGGGGSSGGSSTSSTTASTTKTTSETESLSEYCKKNPSSLFCVTSSFTGTCANGFTATGDALQTAAAKALNKMQCLLDPGNGLEPVRAALQAGTFADALEVKAKNATNFNQTNPLSNSCPADQQVSLSMVGSFVIPLSAMCVYLEALGKIAVLITLIYSTLFVVRGLA